MSFRSFLILGFLLAVPAFPQGPDPATRELIQSLLNRIDTLEKRVAELERDRPGKRPPEPAPALPSPAAAVEAAHAAHEQAIPPEIAHPTYPSLKISGFSDLNFAASDLHAPAAGFSPQTLLRPQSG